MQNISINPANNLYETPYVAGLNDIGEDVPSLDKFMLKISQLPLGAKKVFHDFSTAEFIEEKLSLAFNFSTNQKNKITRIVRDILLAQIFIGDMPKEISSRLNVNLETANNIASMILSELFAPAIEDIKKEQTAAFPNRLTSPAKNVVPNPAVNLDVNKNNVLDLRNK